jgi:hypothetical protein
VTKKVVGVFVRFSCAASAEAESKKRLQGQVLQIKEEIARGLVEMWMY